MAITWAADKKEPQLVISDAKLLKNAVMFVSGWNWWGGKKILFFPCKENLDRKNQATEKVLNLSLIYL